jgi:hypothetical protein
VFYLVLAQILAIAPSTVAAASLRDWIQVGDLVTRPGALLAISHRPGSRVHSLEHPEIPVQLVLSRIVADGPAGADRDGTRADAVHDAIGAAQELHQIIDQLGIVEMNRCHCRRRDPELPQRGRISHCDRNQGRVN